MCVEFVALNINPHSGGGDLHIGSGAITSTTPNSCLVWVENSHNDTVTGVRGSAAYGVVVDAGGLDRVSECNVTATGKGNGTAAYLVGAGGGLHEHGATFRYVCEVSRMCQHLNSTKLAQTCFTRLFNFLQLCH